MSRDSVICENLGLVHACAKRFAGKGMDYDDLFQAGCIGLIKAADGFDAGRGLRFSTYAVPLILGEMRHLFRQGGSVKVGRSLQALARQISRQRQFFAASAGREPTVEELAEALGVESTLIAQAVGAALPPVSLSGGEDAAPLDLPVPSQEEAITDRLALQQVLATLAPRDRALLHLRYHKRQTQQATARELGMTQVQVSRREKALLLTLREKLTV